MALQISGQARLATNRWLWLTGLMTGTLSLGSGVWAMHFIGMLAFRLCTPVSYDPSVTLLSMVPSIVASGIALTLISADRIGPRRLITGGVLVGAGIGAMHYTGMAAMRLGAALRYDLPMFLLSIVVAVVLSILALWVRFGFGHSRLSLHPSLQIGLSGTVMGCAITGMHYTGMAAARFVGPVEAAAGGTANAVFLSLAISLITVVLTVFVLGANGLLRYRELVQRLSALLEEREVMAQGLREARDRAEQAASSRAAFLANMSHEIRTPMNAILGFTDILLRQDVRPDQHRHLESIRNGARALLGLLDGVLDTAKLDRGAVELEPADFDLFQLMDEVISTMGVTAHAKGLELAVDYAPDLARRFHADAPRIRQVLVNLIGNAIKFTEHGRIVLSATLHAGHVEIAVIDTGIGIPDGRLQSIFDPFTQADASTSRRFGGTGLGLTISKKLVELMGGRIWVTSVIGQGSAFHVSLPLAAARQARPKAVASKEAGPKLSPMKILVADDLPGNLELLSIQLADAGHTILPALTGAEAVELMSLQDVDLALMDIHMPAMDGLEATRRIRAQAAERGRSQVPIIALSASVLQVDRRAAENAGMNGFVAKPFDMGTLNREIARVMDGGVRTDARPKPPADVSAIRTLGARLRALFAQGSIEDQAFGAFRAAVAGHARPDLLDELQAAIEDFDFVLAGQRLDRILGDFAA